MISYDFPWISDGNPHDFPVISPWFRCNACAVKPHGKTRPARCCAAYENRRVAGKVLGSASKTWIWPLQNEIIEIIWLVVWNILEHEFDLFYILGMSSSQLTFTPSFFRGVGQPPSVMNGTWLNISGFVFKGIWLIFPMGKASGESIFSGNRVLFFWWSLKQIQVKIRWWFFTNGCSDVGYGMLWPRMIGMTIILCHFVAQKI